MELWTKQHAYCVIPSVIAFILITILLNKLIGKKDLKIRMIPFQIISVIFLILEVIKQVSSIIKGYDLYYIPLHFCSLFLFVLPAMSFYKGKHKDMVDSIACTCMMCLMLFMTIYPNLIYGPWNIENYFNIKNNFFDFHTVTFHNLVMFAFILTIGLRLHTPTKKRHIVPHIVFVSIFAALAATFSQILKTNYANFYHCNIPPLENLRLSVINAIGYFGGQLFYVVVLCGLHIAFVLGAYYLYLLIQKLYNKLTRKKA